MSETPADSRQGCCVLASRASLIGIFYMNSVPWKDGACNRPTNLQGRLVQTWCELVTWPMLNCRHCRWEIFQMGQIWKYSNPQTWNPSFFLFSLYKFLFHNIHGTQSLVPLFCFASNGALDIFPLIKLFQEGNRDCSTLQYSVHLFSIIRLDCTLLIIQCWYFS